MGFRILVVDDEPDLLELVEFTLTQAGYQVETAQTGSDALEVLRVRPPDLLLLDLMLPDLSGIEICKLVRGEAATVDLPVIMLTAKGEEVDDYVTKPFSPRELALRVRAVLGRRLQPAPREPVLTKETLRVDPEAHRCWVDEREIPLTAKEFSLLVTLMRRPNRVFTRERLLDEVWGAQISVTSRTIDTHLKRLREKLGGAGDLIETVRGVGYRFSR
ncbi:MAG: winged helix-turn-helix domain-containing protein [Proteobacteria bacterium]|nr:winged helix-turn-helix domain-containing protein [Pseudomonadota bacterium]